MRLIDADALAREIEKIKWNLQMLDDTQSSDKVWNGVRMAEKKVESAPTIDAVQVVRCKDCVFGMADDSYSPSLYLCQHRWDDWNNWNRGNHYCSYGERKDNEKVVR